MRLSTRPDEQSIARANRKFAIVLLALVLALSAIAFTKTRRWANDAYMESHLAIASEVAKLHLATVIERELLLMQKLADSSVLKLHLQNPEDWALRRQAEADIKSYQILLKEGEIYWSSAKDGIVHLLASGPSVRLDLLKPENNWYQHTLASSQPFHINSGSSVVYGSGLSMVFLNVPVHGIGPSAYQSLGLVGSAIDLRHLSDMITGVFELINPNFLYYIYDENLKIVSSNEERTFQSRLDITDVFPEIRQDLVSLLQANNSSDHIIKSGRKQYLICRVPDFNWFLAIYYPLPTISTISWSVTEIFISMLIICLLSIMAYNVYLRRQRKLYCQDPKSFSSDPLSLNESLSAMMGSDSGNKALPGLELTNPELAGDPGGPARAQSPPGFERESARPEGELSGKKKLDGKGELGPAKSSGLEKTSDSKEAKNNAEIGIPEKPSTEATDSEGGGI